MGLSWRNYLIKSSARVLVVDDFGAWRHFVCSTLQKQPGLRIVGEVSNGAEAVQKAEELEPDLIVLDIGLPTLNGIEAARRIRDKVPKSKILFFSQNPSWDMVEEALRTGLGYVVKSDAGTELLPAVEAVLQGRRFLSSTLAGLNINAQHEKISDKPQPQELLAPLPPTNVQIRHEAEFYEDDKAFVNGFARVIRAVLRVGNIVILIATESHRADILRKLKADKVDVDVAMKQGSYILLDADKTLAAFMVNDMPDPTRCAKLVDDLIVGAVKKANRDHSRVAICGECAPRLLTRGNAEGAVRLEHLWDKVTRSHNADTLCGYLWNSFPQKENSSRFQQICAEHSAIHGRELGY